MNATNLLARSAHTARPPGDAGPVAITDMLSVIVPVLSDQDETAAVYRTYKESLRGQAVRIEFIYVLDRRARRTQAALTELKEAGEPLTLVVLSRSEGEAAALRSGFQRAAGATILTLPAYRQVDPAVLPTVLAALADCDMVLARRTGLKHSRFASIQAAMFHGMTRLLFGHPFDDLVCRVRAYRRQVIEEIAGYNSQQHFLPLLAAERGFRIREVDVHDEAADAPQLTIKAKVKLLPRLRLMLDTLALYVVLKFVRKPLRFFGAIGLPILAIGVAFTAVLAIDRLFFGTSLADRPALVLGVLLIVLGIQIVALGLMGEIIIFASGKQSKDYTVDKII